MQRPGAWASGFRLGRLWRSMCHRGRGPRCHALLSPRPAAAARVGRGPACWALGPPPAPALLPAVTCACRASSEPLAGAGRVPAASVCTPPSPGSADGAPPWGPRAFSRLGRGARGQGSPAALSSCFKIKRLPSSLKRWGTHWWRGGPGAGPAPGAAPAPPVAPRLPASRPGEGALRAAVLPLAAADAGLPPGRPCGLHVDRWGEGTSRHGPWV